MNHKFKFMFILVLILSACGGGEKATAIPTDTQPPPVPTNTKPPPTPTVPPTPSADEHNEQGIAYSDQGYWEQAAAEFQAAIELEPDNAIFYTNLGAALGDLGQFDQALTVLEKALELDPDHAKTHSNLCFVYQEQGQLEAALAECETALALDDADAETYNNLGGIYARQDNLDAAIVQFQKVIQLEPEHDWAHNNLGRAYFELGRLDEAVAELREAIRITPDNAIPFKNLGSALARQELYEQAIPEYQKALELDPNLIAIHKDLGVIYLNLGQEEQAIASLETYLQLEPNDPENAAIEAEIARLKGPAVESSFDDSLFETFSVQDGQVSFRHPPGWQFLPGLDDGFIVVASDLEALGADDFSQPFGFFVGEINWTDDFDSANPLAIHQEWLQGIDPLEPAGDLETVENDTLRQVSRDYTMSDANGALNVTLVTIVNGGRVVNVMAGASAAGQADYATVASAILGTVEVQYADPDMPHDSNEVIVTRVPTMTPVSPTPAPSSNAVSPPTAQTAEANGYFAFDANPGGNYEIFVINADGSDLRQLTFNQNEDVDPSWSPDGSQLVFVSDRDGPRQLYIVDADGLNLRRLTDNKMEYQLPNWSPLGDKIVFASLMDDRADIFVINSDGSGQTNLSNHPSNNLNPAWSPDGSQIAFISDRDGRNQIYVMNADGSHQTRLTDVAGDATFPAWSPTGDRIAFTLVTESEMDIYVIRPDGSDLRRLTVDPGLDAAPVWMSTPGEPLLAFISARSGSTELYTLDPQGSLQQITNMGADVVIGFPDWTARSATTTASIDFVTYTSSDGTLSYRLPSDWLAGETPHENYSTLSLSSDPAMLQEADFSQPLAFMLGELWLTEDYGEHDPATLHEIWIQGIDKTFSLEPEGEPETSNRRGVVQIIQEFSGSAQDGSPLYLTLKTVVNHGRFTVFCVGVSASGRDALSSIIAVILDSIVIQPGPLSVEGIDFTDPTAVLQAVFVAARSQDFAILPYLCDPLHMNDVVTTEMCSITADHELKDPFVQYYGAGRIVGEVEYIEGSKDTFARVSFVYGPSGSLTSATMELIQRDGLWYLLDQTGG